MQPKYNPDRMFDLHRAESKNKLKKNDKIFVGSSGDMLGEWVPSEQIQAVIDLCSLHPDYIFLFLTKNPGRYKEFNFPNNCWTGMTIDNNARTQKYIYKDKFEKKKNTFISLEPLLEEPNDDTRQFIWINANWIIIGGETGGSKKPDEWADLILEDFEDQPTPIFIKSNYKHKHGKHYKEFPNFENK